MKKFRLAIVGAALAGVLSIGFNSSFTNQAVNIGDTGGAPARPDYVNIGDTGGAPARPDYVNIGDTGGAPARPDYVNIGDTGGAPANFNKGDGGSISKLDSHADHF
ncbi:Phr family secreted Rap phosphatase inhibitor [Bacillus toyonensis]|uniref:Phr family secreted Rap phosphatase inhibitor n=1 Tax=Bacillus toyonensis TaxID=155322 RepID=UPI0035DBDB6B